MGMPNSGVVGKNCVFSSGQEVLLSSVQTLYRLKFVSVCPCNPRPCQCAGGGTHSVINNIGCQRSLFIPRTSYFSITCIWQWASHFHFV